MKHRSPLACIVACVVIAGAAQDASAADASWTGSCRQAGAFVPVDPNRVRPYVPAEFALSGAPGFATLLLTGGDCTQTVPGASSSRFGLVAVAVHDPQGVDPTNFYDLSWVFDAKNLAKFVARHGVASSFADDLSYEESLDRSIARADVGRSPLGRFSVTVRAAIVGPPPVELASRHWHVGRYGRVLSETRHTGFDARMGTGVVQADRGSPLAALLGGTRATGFGMTARFDFETTIAPA